MSWSSEFEPDPERHTEKGRAISFSPEETQNQKNFGTTQDLARTTLRLEPDEKKKGGPSRIVVVATLLLAAVAIVALLLYIASGGTPNQSGNDSVQANTDTQSASALASVVNVLDTSAISFEAGTDQFSADGLTNIKSIREALRKSPAETLAIEVRTYSEDSTAANHNLSKAQAQTIKDYLLEDGYVAPRQVTTRGLGSADISAGDQHSHFVTINFPQASVAVQNSTSQFSSFAFAGPTSSWAKSGTPALRSVSGLLKTDTTTDATIDIYTFSPPSDMADNADSNPESDEKISTGSTQSDQLMTGEDLANSIETYLSNQGIDPSRVVSKQVVDEPAEISSGVNNLVSIQTGKPAEVVQLLETVSNLQFTSGKAELDEASQSNLSQLAVELSENSETVIIDVHTFSQKTAEENEELSEKQAQAVANYLSENGVESGRLQTVGSGNSNQFNESGQSTITVLSVSQ